MSGVGRYVGQAFRGIAVVGILAALAGFLAIVAGALEAASRQGVQTYVDLQLTTEQVEGLLVGGFAALVGGMILNLLGNTVASFVEGFSSGAQAAAGTEAAGTGAGGGERVPASERYRQRLERVYLWNAGVMVTLVAVGVLGSAVFGVVGEFARLIVVVLFGSLFTGVLVAALLAGLWYGVRQQATEALVAGFAFSIVFLLYAVLAASAGFAIFALFLGYYSVLARGATSFTFVDSGSVPSAIGNHFE